MPASSWRIAVLVLGLLALSLGAGQSFYVNSMQMRQRYMVEVVTDKLERVKRVRRPAILLGGGSNVLTGLRASLLSDILHRPAYNLALITEGDDYRNALAMLEAGASAGDTVVYASRGFHAGPPILQDAIVKPAGGIDMRVARTDGVIPHGSILRELVTYSTIFGEWSRPENYNPSGDFTMCLGPKHILPELPPVATPERDQYVRDLADFSTRMRKRNITVLLLAPDIYVRDDDVPRWVALHEGFRSQLERAGVEWLRYPESALFVTDESEFCGSNLHPAPRHAAMKTQWLAQQLASRH